MQFTIEKDLTIKGTRGETGNIHITFDRDMTGTKGVFLVKRSFDTKDSDAFLIKNFIFGTNPAISGRELIISLTREDTEHMPILLPDSPFVFASDYKDIECSNYVWAIKLGSSCFTDTVIPRPGTTYPTFRLYNEAYFDKEGTPVVPHPPFPSPDIYATKKDLIHYAAAQKQLTGQLSSGISELSGSVRLGFLNITERHLSDIDGLDKRIDALEREHIDIPAIRQSLSGLQSVVSGQTAAIGVLGIKVSGMESSVTSAVERSIAAADAAISAREEVVVLASSVSSKISTFTDTFITSGGDVVSGVDSKKVYVQNLWKVEPEFPVLGAQMPALGAIDVTRNVITMDDAVQNLNEVDKILSGRISEISSGTGPGTEALSGNVVKEFNAVRGEISTLSSDSKNYTDQMYAQGIGIVSGLGETIRAEVSTLSGNAKSADEVLAARIDAVISGIGPGINVLSGNAKETDVRLSAEIVNIRSGMSGLKADVEGAIEALSGSSKAADERLGTAISQLSSDIGASISGVASSCASEISSLSGKASSADSALASSISTLSGNTSNAISALSSNVGSAISALSGGVASSISSLSGKAAATDSVFSTNISTISSNVYEIEAYLVIDSKSKAKKFKDIETSISSLSSNASAADVAIHNEITMLSGNVKSYVDTVSGDTYEQSVTDALASINWFLEHTYTPWIQTSDRQILKYALDSAASGDAGIRSELSAEITRAKGAEDERIAKASIVKTFDGDLDDNHVPGADATYKFVNSSINNMAAYYITKNKQGDAFATKAELTAAISSKEFYNGGAKRTPTKNDYCVVLADEDHIEKGLTPTTRYVFDGSAWAFQYVINATTFTQAQVDALNSGVTKNGFGAVTSNISTISSNVYEIESALVIDIKSTANKFKKVEASLSSLSSSTANGIQVLSEDLTELEGVVTSNYSTLDGSIRSLSGSVVAVDAGLSSSISTLSSNANSADSVLASDIESLSGNASSADSTLHSEITSLSGNVISECSSIRSGINALSGNVSTISGNVYEIESALVIDIKSTAQKFKDINTSISTLSSNASATDGQLASSIAALSGSASATDSALHSEITSLSGNADTECSSIRASIAALSGNASATDSQLAGSIAALSGNTSSAVSTLGANISTLSGSASSTDAALNSAITSLSGNASATDASLASDISELSGYAGNHEGRIKSLEFENQTQANAWVKAIVPGIVLNAEGTMLDSSEYTEEETMKLVLKLIKKLVK